MSGAFPYVIKPYVKSCDIRLKPWFRFRQQTYDVKPARG
jgi:hypothetical protein